MKKPNNGPTQTLNMNYVDDKAEEFRKVSQKATSNTDILLRYSEQMANIIASAIKKSKDEEQPQTKNKSKRMTIPI